MERLSAQDFSELLNYRHHHAISLYVPTSQIAADSHQNRILFKDLVRDAFRQIEKLDIDEKSSQLIFEAVDRITQDKSFWLHQSKGFCLFVSPSFEQWFRLPIEVPQLAVLSNRFHVKPLISLINERYDFYVLALSKNDVKLYCGDAYGMAEEQVTNLPKSMSEALQLEVIEKEQQFHTSTTGVGVGRRPASYHGNAEWKDDKKKALMRFLHKVEKAVEIHLRGKDAPLLLAGVKYLLPLYRQINRYPGFIVDSVIQGNTEKWNTAELFEEATKILLPLFRENEQQAVEKYYQKVNRRVSQDLAEILREAELGRVETVLVARGVREWGTFDEKNLQVHFDQANTPEAHDLFDLACAKTILNGGKAFVLPPEKVPAGSSIAAIMRY
jgi:hypothetical protein